MGMIKLPKKSISFFKENLDEIFNTGNLAEGQWNQNLQDYVNNLSGSDYSTVTNSNGAGLVSLMCIYKHFFNRSLVLIQANTMYGVQTMVPTSGCELLGYIDCRLETLMPSIEDIKNAIKNYDKKTKDRLIILLSHIGGIVNPDIVEISALCREENIILLEDCAHSLGATLNNKHSGLFGNAGVYSFYATKAIPAGEGGVVVTNDEEIGRMIKKFAIYDRFDQELIIGNNIRISEVQALLLYSVLIEWKEIIENKNLIANQYIKLCTDYDIKYIPQDENGHRGNYYKFILYDERKPIKEVLPNLKTLTSGVYDYSLCKKYNLIPTHHVCLPIWYGQEQSITGQVLSELSEEFK